MYMSGDSISRAAEVGDLATLRALLAGWRRTRGSSTSLATQLDAPVLEDEFQDTPLRLSLRPVNLEPTAEAVEVGRLVLKAAEWSPQSHELFPEAVRKWAVEVMRLGYLVAWDEERFDGDGAAAGLVDLWRSFVLPRAVVRAAAADAARCP